VVIEKTLLQGVLLLRPIAHADSRGLFFESFNQRAMRIAGLDLPFVQDNHSVSSKGVLRGLHYQSQQAQGKLVRVVVGEVFDVAVDIRPSSHTFGRWIGVRLSAENRQMIYIPPGFAHGFLALSERAEVLYKATDYYHPAFERCIAWNDPQIGIDWPLDGAAPVMSQRDQSGQPFASLEHKP
jgi:dTDP-4-dehydrorhamnose 3,5-epimerase